MVEYYLETQKSNQFPLWKAAVWFEETKREDTGNNDYRITFSPAVRDAFIRDTAPEQPLL